MDQEPQGVEVFRTLGKLGLDTSPALESAGNLAEGIKKLDTSLESLIEKSRIAGLALQEAFAKGENQILQGLLDKQAPMLDALLNANAKKQLAAFQEIAKQRILMEQDVQKRILEMNEATARKLSQLVSTPQKTTPTSLQSSPKRTSLDDAFGYRASWFISGGLFYGGIRAIKAVVNEASEMERILVDLRKVMDERETDFAAMRRSILDTAQSYGLLTEEVGKLAIEFARQGRTQKEVEQLLRPAALLMNVAEIKSAEDATRYLTAALRQFGLEAKDAMRVVDVLNLTSNRFGVTAEAIAQAIERAGSVARTTGISLEEMSGHVAALSEATGKSGEQIGTALQTIYSYVLRPQTIKTLEQMGFKVRESADSYRDVNDILADVAARWNELTEAERFNLAQKAAGVRRMSDFIALLRNYDRATQATITAMAAAGSAERENQKLLESYQKQVAQLKATVQELAITLGEGTLLPVLRGVVNGTKEAIETYQKLDPTLRQIIGTVGLLAAGLKAVNVASAAFGGQAIFTKLGGLAALGNLLTGLVSSPWGLTVAAIGAAAGIATLTGAAIANAKRDAAELAKKLEENKEAYNALREVIAESEEGTLKHVTASRELQEVMNRFGSLVPEVVKKWDDLGNAVEVDTVALEKRIEKEKEFAGTSLEDLHEQMDRSRADYDKWLRIREIFGKLWQQLGLSEAEAEAKIADQTRKIHDKRVADEKAFYDALARARAEGYQKAFGPAQEPKWWDPTTGTWRPGMYPYRQERHVGAKPEFWEGIGEELPAIERAKKVLEGLTDAEKALSLQHERELALLPAYASSIDEVNLKLRQNAELTEQARQAQAATLKERENIRKALKAEEDAYKALEKEYNDLAQEYAGVAQLPEDIKDEFDELSKKLREHESNIKALKGQYESLDAKAKDYGNTIISLGTEGIQLDRERNRLLDAYNEALVKAQRTLQDLIGVERELAELRSRQDWVQLFFGSESPQAHEIARAILVKQRQQIDEEISRLVQDFTRKYPDRELRGVPADALTEFHQEMNRLLNQRDALDRALELEDAKERKRREDKEKETQTKIAENEFTIRKAAIDKRIAEIESALELEEEDSQKAFELQQERDRLAIEQHRIAIEELKAQEKEAGLLELPDLTAQIQAEENAITKLEAGIEARHDQWVKDRIARLEQLDMEDLEITDPILAALIKVNQEVEEKFKDVVGMDTEKQRQLLKGYFEVWKGVAEDEANKVVQDVHLSTESKITELQRINRELMTKSLDGVTGSPEIDSAIKQFATEFVDKQNEALRESLIARGFGLDLELAEASLEKDIDVRAKRRAEAIEKYVREDLEKVTGSLVLTPELKLTSLDVLLEKYQVFKDEVPEVYALIADAQKSLTAQVQEENAELERQRIAIKKAGLDTYSEDVDRATKALDDWRTSMQGQVRDLQAVAKETELTNQVISANQKQYSAVFDTLTRLSGELKQPLLAKMLKGEALTPEEGELLETWRQGLTPAMQETYALFTDLIEVLPSLESRIVSLNAGVAELGREAAQFTVRQKLLYNDANLKRYAQAVDEAKNALSMFNAAQEDEVKTIEALDEERTLQENILKALRGEYDATRAQYEAYVRELGGEEARAAIEQGGDAWVSFQQALEANKPHLLDTLETAKGLYDLLPSIGLEITRTETAIRRLGTERSNVWERLAEEQVQAILDDVRLKTVDKMEALRDLNAGFLVKGVEGIAASELVRKAIADLADRFMSEYLDTLRERLEAGGFGLDLALAEITVSDKEAAVKARLRAEAIEKYLREDLERVTGNLLLSPAAKLADVHGLLEKYAQFKDEVPEIFALLTEAEKNLTEEIRQQNAEIERQRAAIDKAGLDTYADAVQAATRRYEDWREATQGQTRTLALIAEESGYVSQILAANEQQYQAVFDYLNSLAGELNQPLLRKLLSGEALLPEEGRRLELWRQGAEKGPLAEDVSLFFELVDMLPGLRSEIARLNAGLAQLGKESAELAAELDAVIREAGLEPFTKATEEAANALERFDLANKTADLQTLEARLELTRKLLEAQKAEYDERLKKAKEFAALANVPWETVQAGGEPLARLREGITGPALTYLEKAIALAQSLPSLEMEIVRTTVDIGELGQEIALLPIREKFTALNSSLEEFSRLMASAALTEEYFAEGILADMKRMELQRQKMQATKEVAEAYRDALTATTAKLKELLPQDAALFDAIASGLPLTKEQAQRWGELNAQLDSLPKEVSTLLPLLTSLRDKNGDLSKSILDAAFSLYRATLAAKGLVEAYDAIVSGAKELKDTFDYRQELRGMENRYNFNYLFGRPGERAMEDWQAEFDAVKQDMEAIAKISAGLRVLGDTTEDEKALAGLIQELAALAEKEPALGITQEQIDSLGKDVPQAMDLAARAASNLEGKLESLVSRKYFLELAREAEEMGQSFEQNVEGAFERAISDMLKGEGDLLDILTTLGQSMVGNMADMLAKGLTRRIFGDPNNPDSLAGRITQWATGKAGDTLGIQTSMTTGAQVASTAMETAIVRGGQTVASIWTAALRSTPTGISFGMSSMPVPSDGSIGVWRMLENASIGGLTTSGAPSVGNWRVLENASMAGVSAAGRGNFLSALLGSGSTPPLAGFDPVTMIATFAIGTLLSGIQKKLSQPLAPIPKDQFNYRIVASEFNPFASPERVYFAGSDRARTEINNWNLDIKVQAQDGTDAGTKIWRQLKSLEQAGSWGRRK